MSDKNTMNNDFTDEQLALEWANLADPFAKDYAIFEFPVRSVKTAQSLQYACVELEHFEKHDAMVRGEAEAKSKGYESRESINDCINVQLLYMSSRRVSDRTKKLFPHPGIIRSMTTEDLALMLNNYDLMRVKRKKTIWTMSEPEMEEAVSDLAKGALDPENFLSRMPLLMLMDFNQHLASHLIKLQNAYSSLTEQPDEPTAKILSSLLQAAPWLSEPLQEKKLSTALLTSESETTE